MCSTLSSVLVHLQCQELLRQQDGYSVLLLLLHLRSQGKRFFICFFFLSAKEQKSRNESLVTSRLVGFEMSWTLYIV